MVRNIVVLGGSSHPQLTETICNHLGIPPAKVLLGKFKVGETRVEIEESVRGKDVFIIQSGGGPVNDHLMELLITISACQTASAKRITAVLPLFPYSRQSDIPYNKTGAPLAKVPGTRSRTGTYSFESRPQTPHPGQPESAGLSANGTEKLHSQLSRMKLEQQPGLNGSAPSSPKTNGLRRSETSESARTESSVHFNDNGNGNSANGTLTKTTKPPPFEPQVGYRQWVAQAGTLIADLLTCAGADHVITMDLHGTCPPPPQCASLMHWRAPVNS
jgi:ribose-phosphate pyrophosphokinase